MKMTLWKNAHMQDLDVRTNVKRQTLSSLLSDGQAQAVGRLRGRAGRENGLDCHFILSFNILVLEAKSSAFWLRHWNLLCGLGLVTPLLQALVSSPVKWRRGWGFAGYSPRLLLMLIVQVFASLQVAWFLQITMGTTATETLAVAGNIFVGMVSTLRPSDLFPGNKQCGRKQIEKNMFSF